MIAPKISIVTPSFNQGNYIEQTICSVLDQQYPNLEYIIMDGGSSDNTVEVIRKYEKYITSWVSTPDHGQTDAINKGFAKCTGEIFNWINSDDYYAENTLKIISEIFEQDKKVQVVCGKETGFYNDSSETVNHPGSIIRSTLEKTIFTGIIDQPCTFFRKNAIDNFFPLSTKLRYVMDRELWYKYLLKFGLGGIVQINDLLTNFRLHQNSKTVNEGAYFEKEFAALKLALLEMIDAPDWLKEDMALQINDLNKRFHFNNIEMDALNKKLMLSEFSYDYAIKNYVKNNLDEAKRGMSLVKKSGGLSRENILLYIKVGLMPVSALQMLKIIKK